MHRLRPYLILLLLLAVTSTVSAQERVWSAALDRYEFICRRCADWRERVEEGKPVPKDSLKALTREISALKQNLQYALGDMSPGQRRRFEAIRDWFTTGSWPEYHIDAVSPCRITPTGRPRPPRGWIKEPLLPISLRSSGSLPFSGALNGPISYRKPLRYPPFAGVTMGVYPDLSWGAFAGIDINRIGIFLKGRTNFRSQPTAYNCLSDGTADGGFFWGGGEQAVQRHQLTLDFSYDILKRVSVYVGGGYGVRNLCWKDVNGQWARVSDRSFSGLALDAGLIVHPVSHGPARGLTLLLGCSWIPTTSSNSGYFDVEAGLAWEFFTIFVKRN